MHRGRALVGGKRVHEPVVIIIVFDRTVGEKDALPVDLDVVRAGEQRLQIQMDAAAIVERLDDAPRRKLFVIQDLIHIQHGAGVIAERRRVVGVHDIRHIGGAFGIGRNVVPCRFQAVLCSRVIEIVVPRIVGHRIGVLHKDPRSDRPDRRVRLRVRRDVEQRTGGHRAEVFAVLVKDV